MVASLPRSVAVGLSSKATSRHPPHLSARWVARAGENSNAPTHPRGDISGSAIASAPRTQTGLPLPMPQILPPQHFPTHKPIPARLSISRPAPVPSNLEPGRMRASAPKPQRIFGEPLLARFLPQPGTAARAHGSCPAVAVCPVAQEPAALRLPRPLGAEGGLLSLLRPPRPPDGVGASLPLPASLGPALGPAPLPRRVAR
jgi:hypothetical protein